MQRSGRRTEETEAQRQPVRGAAAPQVTSSAGAAVPPPLTADVLRAAQRGAGNAAVTGMIARRARTAPATEEFDTGVPEVLNSGGKRFGGPIRQEMESRFNADFSDVRLHTGAAAARSARAIGARAYTSGSHVVIGAGGGDKHTLAHELTHVVQQRKGPVAGTDNGAGLRVSDPGDRFEREAEANAHRVLAGPVPAQTGEPGHPTAAADASAVQRAVIVGGVEVADPARVIADAGQGHLISDTGQLVLSYVPRLPDASLRAEDGEALVIEVERIAAMIDLIHSINSSGILGRRTMSQAGMAFTGSNDEGDRTALAVNVLDARGGGLAAGIRGVVNESLTARDRGSFSVAMERPEDDDMILDEMASDVSGAALDESELAAIREAAEGDQSLIRMLVSAKVNDKKGTLLAESHKATVAQYRALLQDRTQNTAMAIIGRPGADVLTKGAHLGSYESDVPSDRIAPGAGGFTSLVLPSWFEPYGPLLMTRDWPAGVELKFAGNQQITAHYRAKGNDYPVTVDAPDYAREIETQLRRFQVIATHILKTAGL
ncbi:DUF4157 domain-containing protein [Streptomyces sp. NBC_00078]|uniref:eCIS core domain-containing protein n=1 Tax=unclassified Streptomyces TaxID=2593676 RepID=UPI0022570DB0|nr:DUF4157 domain-containing protein [Streptomyces sp. NBC_00078]MCX5422294.1 DUF4157 domain-containing protein [Streptomyces sp. NBC_00078]